MTRAGPGHEPSRGGAGAATPVDFATIARDAEVLSGQIARLRDEIFAPGTAKTLRPFTAAEAE